MQVGRGRLRRVHAGEAELEEKRLAVTAGLNAATAKAYALVDGRR